MADRVPIGTHPGLVSGLVSADLPLADFGRTVEATRVFLRRTDNESGDVVAASVYGETGAVGDSIDVSLGDGIASASATGSVTSGEFYLRVTSSDSNSMNLSGWFEVTDSAGLSTVLVTLPRVKEYLGLSGSGDDDLLANIISGVSTRVKARTSRSIVSAAVSAEIHDGNADDTLVLRRRPVTTVAEVRIDGAAIAAASYQIEPDAGILYRRDEDTPAADASTWDAGRRNISVDYTAGYLTVPEDLVLAATKQAAYEFRNSQPGGNRIGERGTILDAGGSATYLVGPWAPGVLEVLEQYRDRGTG
ncbi:MAG: hypothetical protein CMF57_13120 [Leifsonia sp.]|nr:hypothetical protein [Leifsonia sp.]